MAGSGIHIIPFTEKSPHNPALNFLDACRPWSNGLSKRSTIDIFGKGPALSSNLGSPEPPFSRAKALLAKRDKRLWRRECPFLCRQNLYFHRLESNIVIGPFLYFCPIENSTYDSMAWSYRSGLPSTYDSHPVANENQPKASKPINQKQLRFIKPLFIIKQPRKIEKEHYWFVTLSTL